MSILDLLTGGDRRSIGRANEVVERILQNPSLVGSVFDGILSDDPVVRMRAADVVEKVSARRPDLLQPLVGRLLDEVATSPQHEVRRQVAQVLPRLDLTDEQRRQAEAVLLAYLGARSSIVKASARQALAALALRDPALRARLVPVLGELTRTGSAAVRARCRTIMARLGRAGDTTD